MDGVKVTYENDLLKAAVKILPQDSLQTMESLTERAKREMRYKAQDLILESAPCLVSKMWTTTENWTDGFYVYAQMQIVKIRTEQ